MSKTVAFADPLTARERVVIRGALARHDWRGFWRWGWAETLARHLPETLTLACYVRVMCHAWVASGNKTPDEIGYSEAYKAWERRSLKP